MISVTSLRKLGFWIATRLDSDMNACWVKLSLQVTRGQTNRRSKGGSLETLRVERAPRAGALGTWIITL